MQATLSHYRILEQIGAGGMGVVFRAHDEHLDRDVALKLLHSPREAEANAHRRFYREALTLSKLNHPNIATVHDFGTEAGSDYLVEEYIEGCSLDMLLARGSLPEERILKLGLQLAEGLAAAHERGIIHCDLKPSNVRVTPDGRAKILDFGLARVLRRETSGDATTETLSETGGIAGTFPYMAPEHLLGRTIDRRTDIWALGCVLYEMATGKRAFTCSGPALTEAILHGAPTEISKCNPRIGSALTAIIKKCLDKDSDKRYQSAKEVAVDLRRCSSSAAVGGGLRPRRILSLRAVLVVLIATLAVTAGIRFWPWLKRNWPAGSETPTAINQVAPHELYLAGMRKMERWDKAGNLESAIQSFAQAVQADPGFALGFSALAEAYWAKYRLERDPRWIDEAEMNCRRAAELSNRIPAVYVTLARVHNGRAYYNLALQEIQNALRLEPNSADALLTQGEIYASLGRNEEAESAYKSGSTLRPAYWGGYYEFGGFYFRTQRFQNSVAQFEHALELVPDNALVHAALGGVMQLVGNQADAERHLRESIRLQPSYVAYTNLGALYYGQKRWAESADVTGKALQLNSSDWGVWSNLRLAYEWLGKKDAAEQAAGAELERLQAAANVTPDDPDVQVHLGVLYSQKGLRAKAMPHIEVSLLRAPKSPTILVSAAEAYNNLGERTRAIELVRQALSLGWTLEQLQNDPGQQQILRDPRFSPSAGQSNNVRQPGPE